MKNHIKNYIKIMGLAAVPFGTLQAENYEIEVTQEYKCDPNDPKSEKDGAMWFYFSVSRDGRKLRKKAICWYVDSDVYYLKYGKRYGESSCPIQTVPYLSRYMIKKINLRLEPALCDKEESKWKESYNDVRFAHIEYPGVDFFVVRDPERKCGNTMYKLIIMANDRFGEFCVSSDVPTMVSGTMGSYCSDNEILVSRQEEPFCVQVVDGVLFAYCEDHVLNKTTIDNRTLTFLNRALVGEYNVAMKKVDIFSCFGEKVCKKVKMVENVPTLREALGHLKCESTDYCGFKLSLKKQIQRELIKKLNGEPALEEIKYGNRIYVISTGEWRDIKAEKKEEEPKKEEEKKEEIKKNEKDPFGEN